MNTLQQLDTWHKTRTALLIFGVFELGAAYGFFSLAVNSGSLWQWTLAALLTVGASRNLFLVTTSRNHGNRK